MKKPKMILIVIIGLALSSFARAEAELHCNNAPKSTWGQYYSLAATTDEALTRLHLNFFGLVEGSQAAEEEEPVDWVEDCDVNCSAMNPLKSAAWKNAVPFEIANTETGSGNWTSSTLFINRADLGNQKREFVVRLKVESIERGPQDLRLTCRASYR